MRRRRRCARRTSCTWRSGPASFPSWTGNFAGTRAKNAVGTIANPTNLPQSNPYYNLYTAQLTVSYLPDVFGATRRAVEAAKAQVEVNRFQLEATYLTLSSNVVVTAVQEASLRGQIAATERLLELQHQLTDNVQHQRLLGTASDLDVLAQQSVEAQTAQTLPPLQKQLGQTRDALTALIGRLPSEEPPETFQLDDLTLPVDLPVSLPSKLVEQRPDVRQAEENLHWPRPRSASRSRIYCRSSRSAATSGRARCRWAHYSSRTPDSGMRAHR